MPTVSFLVMAHHQPAQFARLIDELRGQRVVAHIDAKVDESPFRRPDVGYVTDRVSVNWGGFSNDLAIASLLTTALADPATTHVLFLSGQDFPTRPLREFFALLDSDPNRNYLSHQDMTSPGAQFPNLAHDWNSVDLRRKLGRAGRLFTWVERHLPPRAMPRGWTPYRGSTSWCLTRPVAEHVLTALTSRDYRDVQRWLKSTLLPDEIGIQTIVMNSQHAHTVADSDNLPHAPLHYIDWTPGRENPAVLDERDFDAITSSGKFFCRKVAPGRSDALVQQLSAIVNA